MTATRQRLLIGLVTMAVGWTFALRALSLISPWASLAGVTLLILLGWGVLRAARI
jgi:putative Mn2+ efflux pump MntP